MENEKQREKQRDEERESETLGTYTDYVFKSGGLKVGASVCPRPAPASSFFFFSRTIETLKAKA